MSLRPRLICLLLGLVTLLIYLPVRHHEFVVFDDTDYVLENPPVREGLTWAGVKWAITATHAANWHPLTWVSHMVDCQLFGLNAGAHHLVNVLIHATSAVLLFLLLLRLVGTPLPSAFVAALFAWHPLHIEPVAWVAERKEVLCMLFGVLTMLAYTRYTEARKARSPRARYLYGGALVMYALGLLAKPMLVTLPFVLLLLDWWPLQRVLGKTAGNLAPAKALLEKVPFFGLSAASCVLTVIAQKPEAVRSLDQFPLHFRLGNSLLSYGRYLWNTLWPTDLAVIYPIPLNLPMGQVATAAVALALLSWLAWRARRGCPALLMGWLWFLGTLVPVIGLVQVGGQAMADRYTYLPHIGLFIAAVFGIRTLASRWRLSTAALAIAGGLVLAGCLAGTYRQLRYWQNSETLFKRALEVTQGNPIAHINLGVTLQQQGRREEALFQFQEAVRLDPAYVQAHNNLAILFDELDRNDEALAKYEESLRINPSAHLVHCNFGTLLVKLGRHAEAMAQYAEAARLAPNDPLPHYLMGRAALRRGDSQAAIAHFRDALRRNGNDVRTLAQLARVLAADDNAQVRDGQQAVTLAERANSLSEGSNPLVLDVLAMAYAETGRFGDAQRVLQELLSLASAAGEEAPQELKERHQLYLLGRPFRESSTNAVSESQVNAPTPNR